MSSELQKWTAKKKLREILISSGWSTISEQEEIQYGHHIATITSKLPHSIVIRVRFAFGSSPSYDSSYYADFFVEDENGNLATLYSTYRDDYNHFVEKLSTAYRRFVRGVADCHELISFIEPNLVDDLNIEIDLRTLFKREIAISVLPKDEDTFIAIRFLYNGASISVDVTDKGDYGKCTLFKLKTDSILEACNFINLIEWE